MALSVIISEPSYLMQRGISSLLSDLTEAEFIFIIDMKELNEYLDKNMVYAVFINHQLLKNSEEADLFFRLKANTKYIALCGHPDEIVNKQKFNAILNRNAQKDDIVPVVETLLKTNVGQSADNEPLLSAREQEVLKQVAMGYTNQQIADKLFISKHTVISHRKNITSKLGIKTVFIGNFVNHHSR